MTTYRFLPPPPNRDELPAFHPEPHALLVRLGLDLPTPDPETGEYALGETFEADLDEQAHNAIVAAGWVEPVAAKGKKSK